jgi:hypothetical protein
MITLKRHLPHNLKVKDFPSSLSDTLLHYYSPAPKNRMRKEKTISEFLEFVSKY